MLKVSSSSSSSSFLSTSRPFLSLRERVLFIGTQFSISSTLPCIRQPGPRLRVLGVCDFV